MDDSNTPVVEGILRFNLDEPYARDQMMRHLKLSEMCVAIWDFENDVIRPMNKYDTLDGIELKKYTKKTLVETITRKFHEAFEGIDYA